MPQQKLKIPCATVKTQSNQISKKGCIIHVTNGEKLVLLESGKHQRQRNTDCQCWFYTLAGGPEPPAGYEWCGRLDSAETKQDPVGVLQATNSFHVSHFLFVGNGLHSVSLTLPEVQSQIQTVANQKSERMQKSRRDNQETIVSCSNKAGRWFLPKGSISLSLSLYIYIYNTISLSCSARTKATTQVKDEGW